MSKIRSVQQLTKKAALGFIILLYSLFSIGILKSTHFCMGREVSVAFFVPDPTACDTDLFNHARGGCCNNTQDFFRLKNDQKNLSQFSLQSPQWVNLGELYSIRLNPLAVQSENQQVNTDPSPPLPLFKIHCSFVFYGDDWIG